MIPAKLPSTQPDDLAAVASDKPASDWRVAWRQAVTDPTELLGMLDLDALADSLPPDDAGFALRVPRGFVARMQPGDSRDPLLLQVLPQLAETREVAGFVRDAVGDLDARGEARGVLHKYHGRALLVASGACAINCRYCFRRHFPYAEEAAAANQWREALEWLAGHKEIDELILSGGDPLALTDAKLAELLAALQQMPHVRRLRIHSRLPVVLPERVDDALTRLLAEVKLQKVVVIHANHANELDATVAEACCRLRDAGATVLNQSVLLAGINDSEEALAALSERLFAIGVLPYYLHQLDRVAGTAHFEVDDHRALRLITALRNRLPGFLVPKLVREISGEASKRPLA